MFQVLKLQQKIENLTFSYTETDGVEHQYNLTKGKSKALPTAQALSRL